MPVLYTITKELSYFFVHYPSLFFGILKIRQSVYTILNGASSALKKITCISLIIQLYSLGLEKENIYFISRDAPVL